ncbi:hypothetical protein CTA2_455 [Colletotrichum tanaceti]|uniref:Protein kinase domain-containing protein n=1 Tax=Colletotrichum tanaceti TaxID=1306861 RepID=A0A4U6XA62_9PEZI|nr:hypothetical protein CTA2_455 [Colletotrichum tanaceti]TKW52548.1 hypothetical protein CTA1_13425 [Colletotrichum tanaceti]
MEELHRADDEAAVYLARQVPVSCSSPRPNQSNEKCIVKSIRGHWRLQNEADILKRYQSKTPFLRPLIDEIQEPADPSSIVLRYLDSQMLAESNEKRLSRPEIKQVARCVLKALRILHKDEMVHTGLLLSSALLTYVKLDNIFVNYGKGDQRFAEIQLGDCGGVVSQHSRFAKEGLLIGASLTRSPEAMLGLPWGTATDIWSFGNAILSLLYGGGYHLFDPQIEGVHSEDDACKLTVLRRMHRFFGPYPQSYNDFNDPDTITIINHINGQGPPPKPFTVVTPREIPPADKEFLLKIMKLDPRDRPTAEDLLADEWFTEESHDTRVPLPENVN